MKNDCRPFVCYVYASDAETDAVSIKPASVYMSVGWLVTMGHFECGLKTEKKQRATKIKQTPTDHENKCERCTVQRIGFVFDELYENE